MAQNTKKKTTASAGRKNTKKSGNRSKKKKSGQISLSEIIKRKEVGSTLTFVTGLFLLIVALFSGGIGSVWNKIHCLYFSVFGICGYYIPLAILFLGVVYVLNRQKNVYFEKAGELMGLFIIICSLIFVNIEADSAVSFGQAIKNCFINGSTDSFISVKSGGFMGAFLGGAIFALCRNTALSNLILVILLLADIMFLFGITLFKLFMGIKKPAEKVTKVAGEAIEKKKISHEARRRELEEEARKYDSIDPAAIFTELKENDSIPQKKEEKKKELTEEQIEEDIFSLVDKKKNKKEDNAEDSIPDKPELHIVPPVIPVNEEKPVQTKEDAKPEPLSEKESSEFTKSLEDAVAAEEQREYILPPLDCLNRPKPGTKGYSQAELQANGEKLISALNSFNVSASIVGVVPGPTVTRYELSPARGVKISKFVGLADDLALHMAAPAGLRIEAPIPNKAAIGIEIPNRSKTTVTFREIIDTDEFRNSKSKLNVALGKDISGKPIFSNIAKMPHLLVAGTTGSGKSVCLNSMIVSLLYNASPDEVKILLIDPKQVEFGVYNGLPHLLVPVVSDPRKASGALGWAVTEMLSRYKTLNANGVRDIGAYNSLCDERDDLKKMCQIVIFIDELSDLMTVAPAEVEDSIQRLAQMARAAGMHLVVATQRPSVDVITGVIKANIPSRIALTVKSQIDSRTIIDTGGAEKLMGNGDMLYYPVGIPKPVRVQGCYLSDSEIENVVSFIKANGSADYDDDVQKEIDRQAVAEKKKGNETSSGSIDSNDDLLMRAVELIVGTPEKCSISALQRHLGLGFAKAGRLMDTLEEKGIVGPHKGSKPRDVLITKAQWYEMNAMSSETAGEQTAPAEITEEEPELIDTEAED